MNALLLDVEQIKNILIAKVTNGQYSEQEYRELREKLLKSERTIKFFHDPLPLVEIHLNSGGT